MAPIEDDRGAARAPTRSRPSRQRAAAFPLRNSSAAGSPRGGTGLFCDRQHRRLGAITAVLPGARPYSDRRTSFLEFVGPPVRWAPITGLSRARPCPAGGPRCSRRPPRSIASPRPADTPDDGETAQNPPNTVRPTPCAVRHRRRYVVLDLQHSGVAIASTHGVSATACSSPAVLPTSGVPVFGLVVDSRAPRSSRLSGPFNPRAPSPAGRPPARSASTLTCSLSSPQQGSPSTPEHHPVSSAIPGCDPARLHIMAPTCASGPYTAYSPHSGPPSLTYLPPAPARPPRAGQQALGGWASRSRSASQIWTRERCPVPAEGVRRAFPVL